MRFCLTTKEPTLAACLQCVTAASERFVALMSTWHRSCLVKAGQFKVQCIYSARLAPP